MSPNTRTRLLLALIHLAERGTRLVPRRVAAYVCRLGGWLWWLGAPAARAAVRANLRHVLGREPLTSDVLRVFENGALNYWDTFAIPQLSFAEVEGLIDSTGWEHLDNALAVGKGVVMVSGHISSVALTAQVIAARGYPVSTVVERIEPAELFDYFTRARAGLGVKVYPVGPAAARELLGALKRNEVAGLITDRDVLGTGPTVQFFDAPTSFPDGAAVLSLRTGAPVLVAIAWRLPNGRFEGVIEPPIEIARTGDLRADALTLTQAIARRLEYHVGRHAHQWTVFQKRWSDDEVRPRRPAMASAGWTES